MAKVDITGLLTGLAGAPDLEREGIKRASAIQGQGAGSNLARGQALRAPQREQMMRQGAGGLFGVDTRTAGEKLQMVLSQLDMTNPDDLRKIAQIQQSTGDLAGAAQTADRIKQMQQEKASINQTLTTRQSLISRLSQDKKYEDVVPLIASGVFDNNFSELLPMLTSEEKGVELSKPFAGEHNGNPIMLSVRSEEGKDDVVVNALTKEPAPAGTTIDKNGTSVEVNLGQEGRSAFREQLGEKRANSLIEQFNDAKAASLKSDVIDTQWNTISQGAGILTGTGAEIKLGAGKLLKAVGLISGEGEQLISNTETFIANAGNLVAEVIKAFGAGTGLSDADREFAKGIVGGTITLDGESLKRLIKLQARATRKKIQEHNKQIAALGEGVAQFGMTVDVPEFAWAYDQQPKVDVEVQNLIDFYTKPNSGASR
jgi:hypothetical protein